MSRVGDGSQINIWNDPWIPSGKGRRPITPKGRILLNKVSELLIRTLVAGMRN